MVEIERISLGQMAVLQHLATYRYLTTNHMQRLKVSSSRRYIYRLLKDMLERKKPLIGALDFGAIPTIGRLHNIYYLTAYGANIVAEANKGAEVEYPKKVKVFGHDYWHRINCVDYHINVNLWAEENGATVNYFDTYYDRGKIGAEGNIYPRTRIAWEAGKIVPDVIFSISTPEEGDKERLFVLEMHNGPDASRLVKQLKTYTSVLSRGTIEATYNYGSSPRLLLVFDTPATLTRAQKLTIQHDVLRDRAPQVFYKVHNKNFVDFKIAWYSQENVEKALF